MTLLRKTYQKRNDPFYRLHVHLLRCFSDSWAFPNQRKTEATFLHLHKRLESRDMEGRTMQVVLVRVRVERNSNFEAGRSATNWGRKDAGVEMEISETRKRTRAEREIAPESARL
jgi:hypothetical protein